MKKILHVWDLGNTLFREIWDPKVSGFPSVREFVESIGKNPDDPYEFECGHELTFRKGEMFSLDIIPGFREVLSSFEHNEAFTSGVPEQMEWRAEYLNPRVGLDIRSLFQHIASTFDYGNTNIKTKEMLVDYLKKKQTEGYEEVVYADDKLKNCLFFKEAAEEVFPQSRIYHFLNDNGDIRLRSGYIEIGSLLDIIKNEEKYS